jgi:hypothetical protein
MSYRKTTDEANAYPPLPGPRDARQIIRDTNLHRPRVSNLGAEVVAGQWANVDEHAVCRHCGLHIVQLAGDPSLGELAASWWMEMHSGTTVCAGGHTEAHEPLSE